MVKLLELILLLVVCDVRGDLEDKNGDEATRGRQNRLLFYDEEGNLVKTYSNPYRYDSINNAEKTPFPALSFLNPFLNYLRLPTYGAPTPYMIPVSNEVIQQINSDPMYQNKLLTIPRKDLIIEPNPKCNGKRTQITTENCRNFLNCWDGWAFEQECPEGLFFSGEGFCDYPHNVDCSKRSKEPTTTEAPTVAIPTAALQCNTEYETFRNEQQCGEFFVCVDKVPIKFKCPADLVYNQKLGICDYRNRVECNSPQVAIDEHAGQSKPSPCASSNEAAKDPVNSSAPGEPSSGSPASVNPTPIAGSDVKSVITSNSVFNSQSWTSTHVAISRQDAIRQLKLEGIANVIV